MSDPLPAAFAELVERIAASERALRAYQAYGSEAERVAGYQHLSRSIMKAIQAEYRRLGTPEHRFLRAVVAAQHALGPVADDLRAARVPVPSSYPR